MRTVVFCSWFLIYGCCSEYKLEHFLPKRAEKIPKICIEQSECCKSILISKLNSNLSKRQISGILQVLGCFPQIYRDLPKNLQQKYPELSKNEMPVALTKRLYIKGYSPEDFHGEIKGYPSILSSQEKSFVHSIVEHSFKRRAYATKSLIIRKKELYIFVQGDWYKLQNSTSSYFLIDLDSLVFNNKKNLAMLAVDKNNGWFQYIFTKEQDRWSYYAGTGVVIK
ncbi:hypothetical protein [Candidatus Uabimicrobium sp. HlEnr_7]|uniref:hypothetical protein n=1 Tax=Candidatus Uabimicrobium helgolandensis TaxID=3095367 RepID=UPI0035589F8F